jgi:fructose-1-phosphate kinase PfkB-like protein
VVDPAGGTSTEIYEWGPEASRDELDMLLEKIAYLARAADLVVLAGSLPRGVDPGFYAEAIRELGRRRVRAVLDAEGVPLRRGVEAEPWLVSPNQREAEGLVGQEFHDEEDFLMALGAIAELGARNVLIGHEGGAFALLREERRVQRFEARVPLVDAVAHAGAGDAMLAGYLAARVAEQSPEAALRSAVATGAAATLALGAGRFDMREVSRIAGVVVVQAVDPVSAT